MKTGVTTTYTISLSEEHEKKINTALQATDVRNIERITAFLETTLDCVDFPLKNPPLGDNGFISNKILISEYANNGLGKKDVVWVMGWITQNTPIRRLQPFPRTSLNSNYADKVEVVISFNDLDLAKQILHLTREVKKMKIDKLDFVDNKLYINGVCIPISTSARAETKQCWLLSVLFRDCLKKWHTDELVDEYLGIDVSDDDYKTKKYFNTANTINTKISIETGIKDFLITTTKYIQINPKYLM